jgi:hypothetical protein
MPTLTSKSLLVREKAKNIHGHSSVLTRESTYNIKGVYIGGPTSLKDSMGRRGRRDGRVL